VLKRLSFLVIVEDGAQFPLFRITLGHGILPSSGPADEADRVSRTLIYPRFGGVGFLESCGSNEDSDAPQVPPETRRQVIERARAGTKVAQLAQTFGMTEATI
jgi:hypothetical protein